jgi:hypothetical protein
VSRPSRYGSPTSNRDRLKQEFSRTSPLRDLYPRLSQLRVEFAFQDGTSRTPSPQSYSYFPAARGFFRYACPHHGCSGEFDLTEQIAELVGRSGTAPRSRSLSVTCTGHRAELLNPRTACPVCAQVSVSVLIHEQESR